MKHHVDETRSWPVIMTWGECKITLFTVDWRGMTLYKSNAVLSYHVLVTRASKFVIQIIEIINRL